MAEQVGKVVVAEASILWYEALKQQLVPPDVALLLCSSSSYIPPRSSPSIALRGHERQKCPQSPALPSPASVCVEGWQGQGQGDLSALITPYTRRRAV